MILIKRELTNSDTQLIKDFGEYPLRCFGSKEGRFNDFYIVRNSQINRKLNDWMVIVRGIKSGELLTSPEAKQELAESRSSMIAATEEMHTLLHGIKTQFVPLFRINSNSKKLHIRAIQYAMLPLVVLFILLLAICFIVYLTFRLMKIALFKIAPYLFGETISTGASGVFIAVGYNGILEVRLFKPFLKYKSNRSEEEIISHEHLHLLQHVNFSKGKTFSRKCERFRGENVDRLKQLLKNPEDQFELHAYYFDLNEMEARFHEVILSYYQNNHTLPVSQIAFLEMLLTAESIIGKLAAKFLTEHDVNRPTEAKPYSVRSQSTEIDLASTILCLKDKATIRRFLIQVLPVIYANLLVLYGYVDQAKDFMETVECKDLFLEMYGASAIPEPLRI